MPKIVTPLSLSQIKTAKPKEKVYKLPDGGGLALWILPSGSKSWRLQYRRPDGKMNTLTLGLFPRFGLADARAWRKEMLEKIRNGTKPKKLLLPLPASLAHAPCLTKKSVRTNPFQIPKFKAYQPLNTRAASDFWTSTATPIPSTTSTLPPSSVKTAFAFGATAHVLQILPGHSNRQSVSPP